MLKPNEFTLSNGVKIPKIGLGTWKIPDGKEVADAVKYALEIGYRHIDTAQVYENESGVGQGIIDSGVKRNEVFLTTKIWNTIHTYDETIASFEESLNRLKVDYVDLLLIHWPNPIDLRDNNAWQKRNEELWRAFEDLYEQDRIKAIGVSNFMIRHLEPLLKTARIKPHVNQIKLAPGLIQKEVVEYCNKQDILVEAYSPLGHGTAFDNPILIELAKKYNKTIAQIALRWAIQHDFLPLPKSQTRKNIESNAQIFDFNISSDDMDILDNVKGISEEVNPDTRNF